MDRTRTGRLAAALALLAALAGGPARADFLYGVTDAAFPVGPNGLLLRVDPATGAATLVGDTGFQGLEDVVLAPDGRLLTTGFYFDGPNDNINHGGLIELNPTTGVGTLVGRIKTPDGATKFDFVEGLTFAGGVLYGSTSIIGVSPGPDEADRLIRIDPNTGLATQVGLFGAAFRNVEDIAYSPTLGLIGVDIGQLDPSTGFSTFLTRPSLIRIDPNAADPNNLATKLADLPPSSIVLVPDPSGTYQTPFGPYVTGLDVAPDGTIYGSTYQTQFGGVPANLVKIVLDGLGGATFQPVGPIVSPTLPGLQNIDGLQYVATVPEPGSLSLLGLGGLAGLAARRARRRPATA